MPHVVVYGPRLYGGLGRHDLYTEQAIEHVRLTILEMRKGTTAGKLLMIELDTIQVISGLSKPILTTAIDSRMNLPQTRLTYLWRAMSELDIQVEVWTKWLPKAKTIGDRSITELCLAAQSAAVKQIYAAKCINIFNKCRMYVRAIMTSDLTRATDSTQIDMEILNGNKRCATTLKWPRTPKPKREWNVWKAVLHRTLLTNGTTINNFTATAINHVEEQPLSPQPTPTLSRAQIFSTLPLIYQQLVGKITFPPMRD